MRASSLIEVNDLYKSMGILRSYVSRVKDGKEPHREILVRRLRRRKWLTSFFHEIEGFMVPLHCFKIELCYPIMHFYHMVYHITPRRGY